MDFGSFLKKTGRFLGPVGAAAAWVLSVGDNAVNAVNALRDPNLTRTQKKDAVVQEAVAFGATSLGMGLGAWAGVALAGAAGALLVAASPVIIGGLAVTAVGALAAGAVTLAAAGVGGYLGSKVGDAAAPVVANALGFKGQASEKTPFMNALLKPFFGDVSGTDNKIDPARGDKPLVKPDEGVPVVSRVGSDLFDPTPIADTAPQRDDGLPTSRTKTDYSAAQPPRNNQMPDIPDKKVKTVAIRDMSAVSEKVASAAPVQAAPPPSRLNSVPKM